MNILKAARAFCYANGIFKPKATPKQGQFPEWYFMGKDFNKPSLKQLLSDICEFSAKKINQEAPKMKNFAAKCLDYIKSFKK